MLILMLLAGQKDLQRMGTSSSISPGGTGGLPGSSGSAQQEETLQKYFQPIEQGLSN